MEQVGVEDRRAILTVRDRHAPRAVFTVREVRNYEAGQWVTVWEQGRRVAVYPSGETVTTVTVIQACDRTVTRTYRYADGRTRTKVTEEPTC